MSLPSLIGVVVFRGFDIPDLVLSEDKAFNYDILQNSSYPYSVATEAITWYNYPSLHHINYYIDRSSLSLCSNIVNNTVQVIVTSITKYSTAQK